MNYLKPIQIKETKQFIDKVKKLKFLETEYIEETDEYLITVPMRSRFWKYSAKLFRMKDTIFVLQILKHDKNGKHYVYFDDLHKLDSFQELIRLVEIIKEECNIEIEDG